MKKQFCCYCGELLSSSCDCESESSRLGNEIVNEYENSHETHYGWMQQDLIDAWKYER